MTDRTEEQLDRLGNSADRASGSAGRLSRALERAGSAFGGVLRGAPQSLSEFSDGVSKLFNGNGSVTRAMEFAEGYIGVWQELTRSGFNFGNELDRMAISAGQANMRLDDLAKIAQTNGQTIAGMGATAEQGISNFLARQGSFFRNQERQFDGVQRRLMALGLTTSDINERFLQFDTIQTVRNRRLSMSEDQRINQATAFAEEMDRLARLTGKQADQLAAEAVQLERNGQVYARAQMLPEETRDAFRSTIQQLQEVGPQFGNMARDILSRGFIDPNDPAVVMLQSFAPDLVNTLYAAREAQQRGDAAEATRLRDLAAIQAAQVRQSNDYLQQAALGSATIYTQGAADTITSMNESAQALRLAEIGDQFQTSMGRAATSADELARYLNGVLEAERRLQLEGVDSQQVIRAYNEALITLQSMARRVQERTISGIADAATSVSGTAISTIRQTDIPSAVDEILGQAEGILRYYSARESDLAGIIQQRQQALATMAETATGQEQVDLLDQSRRLGEVVTDMRNGLSSEEARRRAAEIDTAAREIRTQNMTVHADNVRLSEGIEQRTSVLREAVSGQHNSIGTLGRTGSFFADFGSGTNVQLHGIEGVFRPNHIEDIMERSARGTISALVDQLNSSTGRSDATSSATLTGSIRNITTTLNGRLNTLTANISRDIRETNTISPEMIGEQMRTALANMPTDMKRAFEDALSNTLRQPIEQLVSVSTRGTEYQERVYKNTRGISQDYLRGA